MITTTVSFVDCGNVGLPPLAARPSPFLLARLPYGGAGQAQPVPRDTHAIAHIVQFDPDAAAGIEQLCRSSGIEARTYADVGIFLRAHLPDVSACLIVHIGSPHAADLEFLEHFRLPEARPPLIVTADQADVRTAVQAMKAGAIDFLDRSRCDQDLLKSVEAAIAIDRARRWADADRAELKARFSKLTDRERQVMSLVTQGLLNKQVAGDLGISEITVKAHRGSAMRKMGARTLANLVRMADAIAALAEAPQAVCRSRA
jgi:FixJ family two-component response regulator